MPVVAEHGMDFSLDEVAARADVTRNLLYHYFPRGRPDILVAVAERAGHQLTDGWVTDQSIPLPQRLAANFSRFIDHATTPTDAWRIHRHGRAAQVPEVQEIIERFEEVVISSVSLNNFGTPDPPPLARLAIKGFIAFSEAVLDEARASGLPREQVLAMVARTFPAVLQAAASASS
jgi:AcrR family transcriptional regulator